MADNVLAVTSGKGGVGKTTTAISLAAALGTDDRPAVVVDADLGMADVGTFLGLDPERTLHDVLAGEVAVDAAITSVAPGLDAVVGDRDLERFPSADPDALGVVLGTLAERYRYVVVDTGGGLSYEAVSPLEAADAVVLVTSPLSAAIDNTKKSGQLAARAGVPVVGVVVTHATEGDDPDSIAGELGVDLLGSVGDDPIVMGSARAEQSLLEYAPDSEPAAAYRGIAATLADGLRSTAVEESGSDPDAEVEGDAGSGGENGAEDDGTAGSGGDGDEAAETDEGVEAGASDGVEANTDDGAADDEPTDEGTANGDTTDDEPTDGSAPAGTESVGGVGPGDGETSSSGKKGADGSRGLLARLLDRFG